MLHFIPDKLCFCASLRMPNWLATNAHVLGAVKNNEVLIKRMSISLGEKLDFSNDFDISSRVIVSASYLLRSSLLSAFLTFRHCAIEGGCAVASPAPLISNTRFINSIDSSVSTSCDLNICIICSCVTFHLSQTDILIWLTCESKNGLNTSTSSSSLLTNECDAKHKLDLHQHNVFYLHVFLLLTFYLCCFENCVSISGRPRYKSHWFFIWTKDHHWLSVWMMIGYCIDISSLQ